MQSFDVESKERRVEMTNIEGKNTKRGVMNGRETKGLRWSSYVLQLRWLYIIPTNLHPHADKSSSWVLLEHGARDRRFLIEYFPDVCQGFLHRNQSFKSLNDKTVPCGSLKVLSFLIGFKLPSNQRTVQGFFFLTNQSH